eukprot:jgi/Tetstr1/465588/TSEL_010235.t1
MYWLRNCLRSEVEAFAEAVDATILAVVERVLGVSFDPSTYGTDTNPVVTDFLAELLHDPDPMAAENDHFLNDAHGSDTYASEMRKRWGRLQAATAGHLGDANARQMEREVEAASGSQKELTAFLDQANNSRLRNEVCAFHATYAFRDHCVHDLGIAVRREVGDLFQQAVPLGNTLPMDELKDLVPDAELSLLAFNVVTGSYDPRSLKYTLLEFKTMRRVLFETCILDMSEYTGMVFGTVGEVSKGVHRTSAIKTDPSNAPPPLDFRDDTSSDDAFIMDGASDCDAGDIQHIKPAAMKPTLDLKNVCIWDNTISTRDIAQSIKIALGSAGYLNTTKGKGTHQEQMILMAGMRHATAHYPMALAIVNNISMDSRKWGYYDHIVDTTTSAATVNEKLTTTISAGQNMEARKRQRQQRVRACPPNLNSYNPRDPQHTTRPNVVCRWCDRPGHT